jgi:hypothetical protein
LTITFTLSVAFQVAACWRAPETFDIFSEDGSKVFVFIPDEYSRGNAYAAVYEIVNNERQLIYAVEDLASFAYEGNFHFSNDMTHFIRTFPAPGMPVFEAFTNGIRTRVVMRSDFIENYAGEEGFTSIGPSYTVNWQIEEHSPYIDTIAINTGEGNILFFDLATARFTSEETLIDETPYEETPVPVLQTQPSPIAISNIVSLNEPESEDPPVPVPQTPPPSTGIYVIIGSVVVIIGVGVYLLEKRKKAQ